MPGMKLQVQCQADHSPPAALLVAYGDGPCSKTPPAAGGGRCWSPPSCTRCCTAGARCCPCSWRPCTQCKACTGGCAVACPRRPRCEVPASLPARGRHSRSLSNADVMGAVGSRSCDMREFRIRLYPPPGKLVPSLSSPAPGLPRCPSLLAWLPDTRHHAGRPCQARSPGELAPRCAAALARQPGAP